MEHDLSVTLCGSAMFIRPETAKDYDAIRHINLVAFAHHPFSDHTEHQIIDRLRRDGALTLSLVAQRGPDVVGHIAFSPVTIDGQDKKWFALGPLAILPGWQRKGIGSALVDAGLKTMRQAGAAGCVLVGDPHYYQRFGFRQHAQLTMTGIPPQFLLCLPLSERTIVPKGKVEHQAAFCVQK